MFSIVGGAALLAVGGVFAWVAGSVALSMVTITPPKDVGDLLATVGFFILGQATMLIGAGFFTAGMIIPQKGKE